MASFTQKQLEISINLGSVTNPQTGEVSQPAFNGANNTVTLSGYRMSALVEKSGAPSMIELQLRIYGLGIGLMNQLSTLGKNTVVISNNTLTLQAGDDQNGVSSVFVGNIKRARIEITGEAEGILHILALSGAQQALQTAPPSSFPSAADAATILSGLATQAGLTFENSGVSVMLHSPYFPGTLLSQIASCAEQANINYVIDNGKLAIWPRDGSRGNGASAVPVISPATGLIGYPTTSGQDLIALRTVFNPQIQVGGQVQVSGSVITAANGTFTVVRMSHEIETQVPGGKWETELEAAPPNYFSGTTLPTGALFNHVASASR